ncbi:MAG: hypothetical protein V4693_15550 [Pseudomonadota bacterium]
MNNALTTIHAAASAGFSGRLAFVRAVVLGCAVACAAAPALAQERDGRRNGQSQQPPVEREQSRAERMPPQRVDPRQFEQNADPRAEEQRRRAAQQDQEHGRRGGRLTPDERRELRRQINEAGIDLYPNTPRR